MHSGGEGSEDDFEFLTLLSLFLSVRIPSMDHTLFMWCSRSNSGLDTC